jgi:hypothetical protein
MLDWTAREACREDAMLNTFSSWLFNVMLWGAIFALAGLSYQVFVGPILSGMSALIALGMILVLSLFWPKY